MSWRRDWARLRELENPRDGYADRYFNRYLSRPITLVLSRTPVTPNQVTLASAALGIAAGVVIARGGRWTPVCGALLLQLSVVLDDVDGELARLTQRFSPLGEWLDNIADTVAHLAVFAGIAVAVARQSGAQALAGSGALLLSGVVITFAIVTYLEQTMLRRPDAPAAVQRLRRYVERLSGRDSSVIVLAFALAGRLDWFLWTAAWGAHAFWLSLLWLWRGAAQALAAGARDSARRINSPNAP